MNEILSIRKMADREIIVKLKTLAAEERGALALLLACLGEADQRKLYAKEGYPSLFSFCVEELLYSEDSACRRIYAARAARNFFEIYSMIADGSLSLTAAAKLGPHLTQTNYSALLSQAQGKRKRDIETIIAHLAPKPDISDRIRQIPNPIPFDHGSLEHHSPSQSDRSSTLDLASGLGVPCGNDISAGAPMLAPNAQPNVQLNAQRNIQPNAQNAPLSPASFVGSDIPVQYPRSGTESERVHPSAPQRVQFSFTGSEELHLRVQRVRELLRHKFPTGRLEELFLEMTRDYLSQHDPDNRAPSKERPPRALESRRIPQWVKDRVWKREQGRCAFLGPLQRRCAAKEWLEFDHRIPWSLGGRSDDPDNIRLLCRTHNQWTAQEIFGEKSWGNGGGKDDLGHDLKV